MLSARFAAYQVDEGGPLRGEKYGHRVTVSIGESFSFGYGFGYFFLLEIFAGRSPRSLHLFLDRVLP